MNPQTNGAPALTISQPPSAATSQIAVLPDAPGEEESASRFHRKIPKLPKPLRDLINSMLDDGIPARQIIAKLEASKDPPLPYPISEMNISPWKDTGYDRERLMMLSDDPRIWRPL